MMMKYWSAVLSCFADIEKFFAKLESIVVAGNEKQSVSVNTEKLIHYTWALATLLPSCV